MQSFEIFGFDRTGTGDNVSLADVQRNFHWQLTSDLSTPDPVHLRPAGFGWSGVNTTGRLVVGNLRIDLVEPAHKFINMIADALPTSIEADEIGDRLIEKAIGDSRIRPIKKRSADK